MEIYDWIFLEEVLANPYYRFKANFNASGIIFFPVSRQHAQIKVGAISYEDGPTGNALAAVISPGQIEIRSHPQFASETVKQILEEILHDDRLQTLRGFTATYRGRIIKQGIVGTKGEKG